MRVLVTGAGGFVGRHLCAHFVRDVHADVIGTDRAEAYGPPPQPRIAWAPADLRDPEAVRSLIRDARPEYVYHLAAQASVPASYEDPWATLDNNIHAQLNLLEAVRAEGQSARVLVVGSNEEYGAPGPDGLPLTEESPLRPANPYAVSKIAQDFLGLQYYIAYGLNVVRVRPFNHTGPGQTAHFVVPAFARQIARVEAGLQEPVIRVGNLSACRDFSDVRDIVRGYVLALTRGRPGEVYNLASGRSRSVRSLLEALLSYSEVPVTVAHDPDLLRPVDVPDVYGSAEKLGRETGWAPRVRFEQTLLDTLVYWREKVHG